MFWQGITANDWSPRGVRGKTGRLGSSPLIRGEDSELSNVIHTSMLRRKQKGRIEGASGGVRDAAIIRTTLTNFQGALHH